MTKVGQKDSKRCALVGDADVHLVDILPFGRFVGRNRKELILVIDHVSISVRDLAKSTAFYLRVLKPLGMKLIVEREATVGFGKKYPEFWLNLRPDHPASPATTGAHCCLRAKSKVDVDSFHSTAIEMGGQSDGLPGDRKAAVADYYGAFILDLDGNKIEAVTFPN